ncbi:arsenate reductase [Ramlibacter sp. H39-3-26]|uniref:arsenate reductase n=1 Tax=Curvibacter soli TaxID=3031331 RepID=UPI0023D9F733|nr:arsenate reductase [Ramlibacter sp. H39-3-26]MDF1485257.1 arsenate reductase [Ramlibacter sp. H39-3-26]
MSIPIVYGIPNCSTVKKSRTWLDEHGVAHAFHDFKKQGVPADRLAAWIAAVGWEKLLNRQGTAWRRLPPETQAQVRDAASASTLMQAQPSVIKRPVVEWPAGTAQAPTVGFVPQQWAQRATGAQNRGRTPSAQSFT